MEVLVMGIGMQKMFDRITETPNTPITDVNELEALITDNYKKSCDIALRYANDNVDDNYATMYMDALDTEAEYLIKRGIKPEKIVIGHAEFFPDEKALLALLELGVNIKSPSYSLLTDALTWNSFEQNLAFGSWMSETRRICLIPSGTGSALTILKPDWNKIFKGQMRNWNWPTTAS